MFFVSLTDIHENPPPIETHLEPYHDPIMTEMDSAIPKSSAPDYDALACDFMFNYETALKSGYCGDKYEQVRAVINHAIAAIERYAASDEFKMLCQAKSSTEAIGTSFEISKTGKLCQYLTTKLVIDFEPSEAPLPAKIFETTVNTWLESAKEITKKPIYIDYKIEKWANVRSVTSLPLHKPDFYYIRDFEKRTHECYQRSEVIPFQIFNTPIGTGKTMFAQSVCASCRIPALYFLFGREWLKNDNRIQSQYKPFLGISKLMYGAVERDFNTARSSSFHFETKWNLVGITVALFHKLLELKKAHPKKGWLELQCEIDHIKYTKMSIDEAMEEFRKIKIEYKGPVRIFVDHCDFDPDTDLRRFVFIRWVYWSLHVALVFLGTDPRISSIPKDAIHMIF